MAKHDIVVLNSTSSGFETDLGNNVARIKGDADDLFQVKNASGVDKFAVSSIENSMIVSGDLTLTGNLSSSLSSTASFGRIDVTNLTGDASQMTNVDQRTHVSSSKQLAARISGAFQHGFELIGENRVISGSATSTGSFTRVFANKYSGDASDMFNVNEAGHFSSSAQLASNISGSFTSGFLYSGKISGSSTSTGSFGKVEFSGQIGGNAAGVTIDESGFFSGSAQLASRISGSFNKGFEYTGLLGTETPTLTTTQSIKLDESDDFLKINPIFVSGSEGDDKLYGERRFTLSMWLKFNADNGSRNTFIMAGAQMGSVSGMYLWMQSGTIRGQFKIKQGSTMQTADLAGIGAIEIGKWHHLLLSYESNRPTPNVSGSFLTALDGIQKTFEVMQSGSYITTSMPPGGGSTIGTYNGSSENTNMTIADITMWKHSIQSASSDAGITSGSLMTTLFNHGIVPDYSASFSTDYPDAYREKLKFAFNFDSSSYAGSSYSMYDRTGNTGFALTSNNVDEGKIVSGSGDYPTEGVFYTTASFGRIDVNSISGDASQVTGLEQALPVGTISSSAQIASKISGSFTSGFLVDGTVSGSSTSTSSFGKYEFGSTITITDVSGLTGVPSSEGFISSSAQIADRISGSFNKGFEFSGKISGSATSTGSFGKVVANTYNADASNVTGFTLPSGLASGSAGFASQISGSFKGGFEMIEGGVISSSIGFISSSISSSTTEIGMGHGNDGSTSESIASASFSIGLANFNNLKINDGAVTSLSHTTKMLSQGIISRNEEYISGSLRGLPRFGQNALISGSATSTGSYARLRAESITLKDIVGDVRKTISGSMNHATYTSGSFRPVGTDKPIKIPIFGRGHTVNTQQFTASGSMENQKYRTKMGQLFIDNFGRLNMTVQTGSMVTQAGAWEAGPQTIIHNGGYAATAGMRDAFIMAGPYFGSGSAIYDGIGWQQTSDVTTQNHSNRAANCGIGTVDAAFIMRYMSGAQSGNPTGRYGAFPNPPAHGVLQEFWDGVGWYRGPNSNAPTVTHVKRGGTAGKVGSVNSHIAFNGDDYPTGTGTAAWDGVSWHDVGPHTPTARDNGGGFGGVYDGVVAGGASPNNTCVDEWNGVSWSTATALPTAQDKGMGVGPQTAGMVTGGSYPYRLVQEYNGTSWSEGTSLPANMGNHGSGGTAAAAFAANTAATYLWTGGFVTGSVTTNTDKGYNPFSQNPTGRYLLTKKLQANSSPSYAGGIVTSGSSDGFGGGY